VFNSKTYTFAGTYRDTLQSVSGCDSIVVTQLTVNPTYSVNNPRTICSGGSYVFNSNTYTIAGTYRDTLQSVSGCDSIIVTQLTVNPKPITSAITGASPASFNSIESYSVLPTVNSTYNWIITNGTQLSGSNTNAITVQWGSSLALTAVGVVETDLNGCKGDTVTKSVILPVSLVWFNAHKNGADGVLNWRTSSELNNNGFEIQRSYEGIIFDSVSFVKGQGTSMVRIDYEYIDEAVFKKFSKKSTLYYRLKQYDFDGKYAYSNIATVINPDIDATDLEIVVFPNPFKSDFDVRIVSSTDNRATIRVFDALGKNVLSMDKDIKSGESLIPITENNDWKSGLYLISVTINNKTHTIRAIKR
jgi:hypothetical protein